MAEQREQLPMVGDGGRSSLRADCGNCFGLCCVVPAFSASADFAIDKPAGAPCPNLQPDFGCSIHEDLRTRGFPGCTAYDCFGAGQKVAQVTFGGRDWREAPETAEPMFAAFRTVRDLHELLWYLTEALTLPGTESLHGDLDRALERTERLTLRGAEELARLDVAGHWQEVSGLLLRVSDLVRADIRRDETDFRGADLIGRSLRGADLSGATFRGAYLIGADLRGTRLVAADFIGADLRGADLAGADLRRSIFLTQPQVSSAKGDPATALPPLLTRPAHWATGSRG